MENEVPSIPAGRRSRLTRGNGVTTDFVYDNASRLTEIVHRKPDGTVLSSFAYTFDPAGNITEMRFANGDVAQYDYDAKDQLTGEHRRGTLNYDIIFTYDPVGNRLKQVRSGDLKDPCRIRGTQYVTIDHVGQAWYDDDMPRIGGDEVSVEFGGHNT